MDLNIPPLTRLKHSLNEETRNYRHNIKCIDRDEEERLSNP